MRGGIICQTGERKLITLYAAKGTGSVAPQAVLALAGADHNIVWIDYSATEHHSSAFLAVNPRGQLPALTLDDGTVLTESAAIMLHLADCYPEAGLLENPGSPQRAQTYRWIVFMATNVYEDFLRMEYPANYTVDSTAEASVSSSGAASMDRSWGILSQALRDRQTLVGEKLSIADIYLAMLFSWHPDQKGLNTRYPNLLPAVRNALTHPEVQKVFDDNGCTI